MHCYVTSLGEDSQGIGSSNTNDKVMCRPKTVICRTHLNCGLPRAAS